MKKQDILTLAKGGFFEATAHCLPADEFYKWYTFRRKLFASLLEIKRDEDALREQCGIRPGQKDVAKETKERFLEVEKKLLDENIAVEISARIPFKYYKEIYDENNIGGRDIFSAVAVESLVIDHLFEA
jgi:hypothetical protein